MRLLPVALCGILLTAGVAGGSVARPPTPPADPALDLIAAKCIGCTEAKVVALKRRPTQNGATS